MKTLRGEHEPEQGAEAEFEVRQQPDDVRRLGAALVAFIALMSIGISLVIAGAIWIGFVHARDPRWDVPPPAGTLERTLIDGTRRAHDLDQQKRKELSRWGWVDRSAGVARIPIDRAIDLVVKEAP